MTLLHTPCEPTLCFPDIGSGKGGQCALRRWHPASRITLRLSPSFAKQHLQLARLAAQGVFSQKFVAEAYISQGNQVFKPQLRNTLSVFSRPLKFFQRPRRSLSMAGGCVAFAARSR